MTANRDFDRYKDCFSCKREIDEVTVKLKRVVVGPDTYRRSDADGKFEKYCTDCVSGTLKTKPDVWYGYGSGTHTEENICDPQTGKPIPFSSPEQKKAAMKMAGVVEAGDTFHGARTVFTK